MLFACEGSHFCCQSGKNKAQFAKYFTEPSAELLALYRSHWLLGIAGVNVDARTGEQLRTSFSAQSRKYNCLFALAQHEIQSSTLQREIKLSTPYSPANVRIHGTMYRRLLSAEDAAPLRYLLVDPLARADVAVQQGLRRATLTRLQALLLPGNTYMQQLRRSACVPGPVAEATVVLEWHEGIDEVAAVVDIDPARSRTPRTVCFQMKRQSAPEYLHPLSPMYEPLSYPLWFPTGGRGWSTDMTRTSSLC